MKIIKLYVVVLQTFYFLIANAQYTRYGSMCLRPSENPTVIDYSSGMRLWNFAPENMLSGNTLNYMTYRYNWALKDQSGHLWPNVTMAGVTTYALPTSISICGEQPSYFAQKVLLDVINNDPNAARLLGMRPGQTSNTIEHAISFVMEPEQGLLYMGGNYLTLTLRVDVYMVQMSPDHTPSLTHCVVGISLTTSCEYDEWYGIEAVVTAVGHGFSHPTVINYGHPGISMFASQFLSLTAYYEQRSTSFLLHEFVYPHISTSETDDWTPSDWAHACGTVTGNRVSVINSTDGMFLAHDFLNAACKPRFIRTQDQLNHCFSLIHQYSPAVHHSVPIAVVSANDMNWGKIKEIVVQNTSVAGTSTMVRSIYTYSYGDETLDIVARVDLTVYTESTLVPHAMTRWFNLEYNDAVYTVRSHDAVVSNLTGLSLYTTERFPVQPCELDTEVPLLGDECTIFNNETASFWSKIPNVATPAVNSNNVCLMPTTGPCHVVKQDAHPKMDTNTLASAVFMYYGTFILIYTGCVIGLSVVVANLFIAPYIQRWRVAKKKNLPPAPKQSIVSKAEVRKAVPAEHIGTEPAKSFFIPAKHDTAKPDVARVKPPSAPSTKEMPRIEKEKKATGSRKRTQSHSSSTTPVSPRAEHHTEKKSHSLLNLITHKSGALNKIAHSKSAHHALAAIEMTNPEVGVAIGAAKKLEKKAKIAHSAVTKFENMLKPVELGIIPKEPDSVEINIHSGKKKE